MKKVWKRLLALILAMAMCLSLIGANVWAAELEPQAESETASVETTEDGTESVQSDEDASGEESAQEEDAAGESAPEEGKTEGNSGEESSQEEDPAEESDPAGEEASLTPQGIVDSGDCGKNAKWTLDSEGTLTISGTGEISNRPDVSSFVKEMVIENGLTSIPDSAFKSDYTYYMNYYQTLERVTIPDSISSIGNYAFEACGKLHTVIIGTGLTNIGHSAFHNCVKLESIVIPDGVSSIKYDTFWGCTSLQRVNIGTGLTSIEQSAFWHCYNLVNINIPDSVTSIGDYAFNCCTSLASANIPDSVTSIGQSAFEGCSSLASVNIPAGVTSIEKSAFEGCSLLASVNIPDGVTRIGTSAFYCCTSLASVYIPGSVTSIRYGAFGCCANLAEVYFLGKAPFFDYECFKNSYNVTAYYPANDPTWTDDVKQNYEGNITWKEWVPGTEIAPDVNKEVSTYSEKYTFTTEIESGNDKVEVEKTEDCKYRDSYFTNPSDEYNHALAKMSLALAMSAFNSPEGVKLNARPDAGKYTYRNPDSTYALENTGAKNVVNLLYECGFGHIRVNQDYLVTTRYSVKSGEEAVNDGNNIGVCIGSKKLENDYTLIAVALRGAGYGDEWIGNFNAYNTGGSFHPGFKRASNRALTEILNYINNQKISGKVKVWITGYSRSGATANLTAAKLCENNYDVITLRSDDVYAYTFEAPQGTKDKNAGDEKYEGIWNIINQIDPVPKVAMTKWGYRRYGQDVYLPCQYTKSKVYNQYKKEVRKQFNQYQEEGYIILPHILNQMKTVNTLADGLAGGLGSDSTDRTRTIMYLLQKRYIDKAQSGAKELTFTEGLYDAFFTLLNNINFAQSVAFENSINQIKNQLGAVVISHYPTMTLAWMKTVPESAISGTGGMCRYVRANCPVDLSVYDEDGVLQARIIDDTVYPEEDATIEAEVDADGQKVVCVPGDANATIKVNATDSGTFNYSVSEYDIGEQKTTKLLNYFDIPISDGYELEATIKAENSEESDRYKLSSKDGEIKASEVLNGVEIKFYDVTVQAEGSGSVTGSQNKERGEFAKVTATPDDGKRFLGWYEGGKLVSEEAEYRFCVLKDTVLVGRFTEHTHTYGAPKWKWSADFKSATAEFVCTENDDTQTVKAEVKEEYTPATETEEGKRVYTATLSFEGKTYTDTKTVVLEKIAKPENTITCNDRFIKQTNAKKAQSFKLNASANGAALRYKSNNKKVTVAKNGKVTIKKGFVGIAIITITATETEDYPSTSKDVTVIVNPSATKLSGVKWDKKKKAAKIAWKKNNTGKGYEIQYSTDKKFAKAKTVKIKRNKTVKATVKKLSKGKTYYFRIRTVNGKTYSNWSKVKTLKIKK